MAVRTGRGMFTPRVRTFLRFDFLSGRSWRQGDLMKSAEGSQMSKLFISTILGGLKVQSTFVNASKVFFAKHHCINTIILHAKNTILSREREPRLVEVEEGRLRCVVMVTWNSPQFFSSSSLCLPRRPFKLFSHAISIIFSALLCLLSHGESPYKTSSRHEAHEASKHCGVYEMCMCM